MINWLKSLLGIGKIVPHDTMTVDEYKQHVEEAKKPAAPKKKTTTKKQSAKTNQDKVLNAMTKKELLEVAKVHGIKANASLSKAELVKRVKNG
jgi:hypothetical protein